MRNRSYMAGFILLAQMLTSTVWAGEVRVAVASNFLATMKEMVRHFESDAGHKVVVSSGSSGKLYAQIKHGAPFDIFFSADVKRPKLMETEGLAVAGSRFTYAIGRLSLWSADPNFVEGEGKRVLSEKKFQHLAIANPKTAPYGTAAKSVLQKLGLWTQVKGRLVQGENIGQTFQFVFSKNAELGFVALSQVVDPKINGAGSRWNVPMKFHAPLKQQAVLLVNGQENKAAKAFLGYVKGADAQKIIKQFGYGLAETAKAK